MHKLKDIATALAVIAVLGPCGPTAAATMIRIGHSQASEEPLWLMDTPKGVTPNRGKGYDFTLTPFRGANDRMRAFEAGALDCATAAAVSIIYASAGGIPLKAIASISRETSRSPSITSFYVRDDSGIHNVRDLKDRIVALTGFRAGTEVWVRAALHKDGLNADRDVKFKVVGFPQMADALRAKQIDLALLAEPFLSIEKKKGGLRKLFDSRYGLPFDEDLQTLFCSEDFLKKQREAVRSFATDFISTMRYYLANIGEARTALVNAKKVPVDLANYLSLPDYDREPSGRLDPAVWAKLQDAMIAVGFMDRRIDPAAIIDPSVLPQ
jgi:ABC-type nitrate/sulfonate/bicarbonate transport system substrate-binding protein